MNGRTAITTCPRSTMTARLRRSGSGSGSRHPVLRNEQEPSASSGPNFPNAPHTRQLAWQGLLPAWICWWRLACNNSRFSEVSRPVIAAEQDRETVQDCPPNQLVMPIRSPCGSRSWPARKLKGSLSWEDSQHEIAPCARWATERGPRADSVRASSASVATDITLITRESHQPQVRPYQFVFAPFGLLASASTAASSKTFWSASPTPSHRKDARVAGLSSVSRPKRTADVRNAPSADW